MSVGRCRQRFPPGTWTSAGRQEDGLHYFQGVPRVPRAAPAISPSTGCSLDLAQTAVHEEFTASDVTAFVGGEERDRLGDLICGSRSAQRNGRSDGLDVVVLLPFRNPKACVIARRRNDTRTHRVNADVPTLQVHGPIARKRAERRFGGTIDAEGRVSLNGNQRGVQANRAARGHQTQCALNREESDPRSAAVSGIPSG